MKRRAPSGFTLIEVIVAIVLSAIAMAAILPMLDRVFLLSHEPRTTLQAGLSLQSAMDELVAYHHAHTNDLPELRQHVAESFPRGEISALQCDYIAFTDEGIEPGPVSTNNLLKITLRNELGETATRLFPVPFAEPL